MRFKGNDKKFELYTIDVCLDMIELEPEAKRELTSAEMKKRRVLNRYKRNRFKNSALRGDITVADAFETDDDLSIMRKPYK